MITVRPARPADGPAIGRIHVEAWRDAYAGLLPDAMLLRLSPEIEGERWVRAMRRRETVLVAVDDAAGVIGFGSCGRCRQRNLPYDGEVFTLYLQPGYQGRGVGRLLLAALFRALADAGHTSALIWVLRDNQSRYFYEAMGGRHVADREERLWGTAVPESAYGWKTLTLACSPQ